MRHGGRPPRRTSPVSLGRAAISPKSLPLFTVRLDSLMSKYRGETASKFLVFDLVFDEVASRRGVSLFDQFDEFDELGADRAGNDVDQARRILNSRQQSGPADAPRQVVGALLHRVLVLLLAGRLRGLGEGATQAVLPGGIRRPEHK